MDECRITDIHVSKLKLGFVNIGCTNVCNASCVHCPTGKAETDHIPRGTMAMQDFHSVINQVVEHCDVTAGLSFGLFGDSLVDPLLVDRVRYVTHQLPGVAVQCNTNAAAYSPSKHSILADLVDTMNVHIESLRPDVYEFLMNPLRFERVMPKIDLILRDFGRKTQIGVPLHRLNLAERQVITDYFLDRGAGQVVFVAVSTRCSTNGIFDHLAFAPFHPRCRSGKLDDLVVDWTALSWRAATISNAMSHWAIYAPPLSATCWMRPLAATS